MWLKISNATLKCGCHWHFKKKLIKKLEVPSVRCSYEREIVFLFPCNKAGSIFRLTFLLDPALFLVGHLLISICLKLSFQRFCVCFLILGGGLFGCCGFFLTCIKINIYLQDTTTTLFLTLEMAISALPHPVMICVFVSCVFSFQILKQVSPE